MKKILFISALLFLTGQGFSQSFTPPPGCIAFWPLAGNANDYVGTNNGVWQGTTAYTTNGLTVAASFNGSSWISMGNDTNFYFGTNNFSVEYWWYFAQNGNADACVDYGANQGWALGWSSTGFVFYYDGVNGIFIPTPMAIGQWRHIAMTRSGSTFNFYTNGVFAGSGSSTESLATATQPFLLGSAGGGYNSVGQMADVALCTNALTAGQIAANYTAGIQPALSAGTNWLSRASLPSAKTRKKR